MKKAVFVLCALFLSRTLSAQILSGYWTTGEFGIGGYWSEDTVSDAVGIWDILQFNFTDCRTGLSLQVSPFHSDTLVNIPEDQLDTYNFISFVNAKVSYDFLKSDRLVLSPYLSIHCLSDNKCGYRLEGGMEFAIIEADVFDLMLPYTPGISIVKAWAGGGIRSNRLYATCGISIDLGALIYSSLSEKLEELE